MRSILIVLVLATPAFSQEFFGFTEALCWQPSSNDFQNQFNSSLTIDHDWSAGYRVGLGLQNLGAWKASWTYTAFEVSDSRVWTDMRTADASSYGDLDYQVHDFEVGRVFCISQRFQAEAFGGFRWGQIDYSLRDAIGGTGATSLAQFSNTDSYGGRLGARGRYYLLSGLSMFGHGAATGSVSTTENVGVSSTAAWNVSDDHENHGVDAAAGLAWECGMLEIAAGYEWNWLADVIQRRGALSQPDYDDLRLEGAFLRITGRY